MDQVLLESRDIQSNDFESEYLNKLDRLCFLFFETCLHL
jgi:hypothetical protein